MRNIFLSFLLIFSYGCEAQYATPAVTIGSNYNKITTTPDGEQLIVSIGNSIMVTSDGTAPTPTAGALQEWNGSAFVAVTSDVAAANTGTLFPQFANGYLADLGYKTLLVNKCSPGSEFSPNGDNNNWSPTGTLYADAITEIDQALADQGLELPTAILFDLGINDANGAIALATIRGDIDLLFAKLAGKYPGVPILVMQIGSLSSSVPVNSRIAEIRKHIKRQVITYDQASFVAPLTSMRGAGYYQADFLHITQTGQNEIAKMFVRWFNNPTYSKWSRSIIASHFDELSTTRKDLIETFVQTTTYASVEQFLNFHTTVESNVYLDWGFMGLPVDLGFDFVANDAITTNPTGTKAFATGYIPSFMFINCSQNDMGFGVKVKSNSTAAGTAASIMACTATAQSILEQTTTPGELYRINDATLNQYTTETSFQADALYEGGRNSTAKSLYKNGTQLATATVASTGFTSDAFGIGCRHASGTPTNIINAEFEYSFVRKFSTVTPAQVYADCEALRDGW